MPGKSGVVFCLVFILLLLTVSRAPAGEAAAKDKDAQLLKEIERELGPESPDAPVTRAVEPVWRAASEALTFGDRSAAYMNVSVIPTFVFSYMENPPNKSEGHDPYRNGLNVQEVELRFEGAIDPYAQGVFSLNFGDDFVEIHEGYVEYVKLPHGLSLKTGKFFIPFGRHNPTHLHAWNFVDAPLANKRMFTSEGLVEWAAGASWLTPLPFYSTVTAGYMNGDNGQSFGGDPNADFNPGWFARWEGFFDPEEELGVLLGFSAVGARNTTGRDNWSNVFGADLGLKYDYPYPDPDRRFVQLRTEYMKRVAQVPGGNLSEDGLYVELAWKFALRWQVAARYDHLALWVDDGDLARPGVAGNVPANYREIPEGDRRGCFSLAFFETEFLRWLLQYDIARRPDGNYEHAGFLQLSFVLGAHGAHQY